MAFEYLAYDLCRNSSCKSVISDELHSPRNVDSPFELTATEFKKLYSIPPNLAEELIYQLDGELRRSRISAISTEKQVLACLRFFATGCYQKPVGEQSGIALSQPSISRAIHRVTDAINKILFNGHIKFPKTQIEQMAAKVTFASSSTPFIPGTMGIIDCTYVSILAPRKNADIYVNPEGIHSIKVQMICDPNLNILNVNAKHPGSRKNTLIWNTSGVRNVMEKSFENGHDEAFLIGYSEYPLEPWLMTPLPYQPEGSPKFRYNEFLYEALSPMERFFKVFKQMWKCISPQRILSYDPDFAGRVVNACAVLHNIINQHEVKVVEGLIENDIVDNDTMVYNETYRSELSSKAKQVQDRIIADFFT